MANIMVLPDQLFVSGIVELKTTLSDNRTISGGQTLTVRQQFVCLSNTMVETSIQKISLY